MTLPSWGQRPPPDELVALYDAQIVKIGITTAPGAAAGNSIIDSSLIGLNAGSFASMGIVLYPGNTALVDSMATIAFNNVNGELTLTKAYKGIALPIPAGVPYMMLTEAAGGALSPAQALQLATAAAGVITIMADLGVPLANAFDNILERDVIGNKADTPNIVLDNTSSLVRWAKGILSQVNALIANLPHAEVPVSVSATIGGANVFNLAAPGVHYTVDSLVLKCDDPNPDTVNVLLYQLVNGAPVNTKTFAITHANYTEFFSLMDLFGLPFLAGDNLRIVVQATGGAGYAVLGSYAYKST
jgi:hypothetical protein